MVFYEMIAGRPPFEGEGVGDILGKHQYVAPVPPSAVHPAVPAQLEALILHSLAKRPEDRPQSMAEMARRLEPLWPIASDGHAFAIGAPSAQPQASTTLGASSGQAVSVRAQKRRTGLIVGGVVAVLLAGGGALLAKRGSGNDRVPEIPTKEATAPPAEPPLPGSTKLEDAKRALSEDRWTNAVALAEEALAADPGNSEAKAVRDRADREAQAETAYEQLLVAVAKKDLAAIDTLYQTIPADSVYRERAAPSRARARQEWAAGERSKIEVYVRKGACTEAKRMAAAVAERIPEIEAELDTLTGGCSARPKRKEEPPPAHVAPPAPVPAPTPGADFEQLVAKARDASKSADFGVALATAEDALRLRPDDAEAATLAALAACHLKNATKAQGYMSKMSGSRQSLVRQACLSESIALDHPDAGPATAGTTDLPETLDKSDIDAGMRSVAGDVRRCKSGYGPSGAFTVELTVGADGTVTGASVSPLLAGTATGACVERAVRAARFKRAKNPTTFNYPYTFFR